MLFSSLPLFVRSFGILCSNVDSFPLLPFILTSDRVAYSVDYTRRLATSRKPRRYTRATSSAHLAVAADFVRIGYQSAVWGGLRCQNMPPCGDCCNEARRRRRCGGRPHLRHASLPKGVGIQSKKGKRGERAKWHQNPQLDTACAAPPVQARQVLLKCFSIG